jgi:hypothetical protein
MALQCKQYVEENHVRKTNREENWKVTLNSYSESFTGFNTNYYIDYLSTDVMERVLSDYIKLFFRHSIRPSS